MTITPEAILSVMKMLDSQGESVSLLDVLKSRAVRGKPPYSFCGTTMWKWLTQHGYDGSTEAYMALVRVYAAENGISMPRSDDQKG